MKKIKCEWCNHHYDLDKYDSCPKCGGANTNLDNIVEIKDEKLENKIDKIEDKIDKIEDKIKNEESELKWSNFLKILGILFLCIIFLGIISSFDSSEVDKYDLVFYYLKNNKPIKVEGGEMYVESLQINKNYIYSDSINIDVNLSIDDSDYEGEHIIDFYLYQGNNKYRLNGRYFSHDNVLETNDLFKGSKIFKAGFDLDLVPNENSFNFDKLLIECDGESYEFDLETEETSYSFDGSNNIDYSVSDKISYGNNSTLYIDGLSLYNDYSGSRIYLTLSTLINGGNEEILKVSLKDTNGLIHRAYLNSYNKFKEDELLRTILKNDDICFDVYLLNREFKSLIIEIGEDIYEIPISIVE